MKLWGNGGLGSNLNLNLNFTLRHGDDLEVLSITNPDLLVYI